MSLNEQIAQFLAIDAIEIAKREPVACVMRSCRSTRECRFPNNCERAAIAKAEGK